MARHRHVDKRDHRVDDTDNANRNLLTLVGEIQWVGLVLHAIARQR